MGKSTIAQRVGDQPADAAGRSKRGRSPTDRTRFEDLMCDLSPLLATASSGDTRVITAGLEKLASFLELERAFLGRFIDGRLCIGHQWISETLTPQQRQFLEVVDPKEVWLAEECLQGRTVMIRDPDEFPAEATFCRRYFKGNELKATVWIPGVVSSKIVGAVVLDSFAQPLEWSEVVVNRLKVPVELLFSELARHEAAAQLRERIQFEELVAGLSTAFVDLATEQVDDHIEKALGKVASFLGMSLSTVLVFDRDLKAFRVTHEWPQDQALFRGAVLGKGEYQWLANELSKQEPILITRLEDFPPEAVHERAAFKKYGLESILWVPFTMGEGGLGYVAFNSLGRETPVSDHLVPRLALLGELIGHALRRKMVDLRLQQAFSEIEALKDRLEADNLYLRNEVSRQYRSGEIVGNSQALQQVLEQAQQVAETDSTVLILGDTGTGKELLARFIHQHSGRSERPLVKVNCGALPATLVEAELFGHERGAYTGALSKQIGRFEIADGSTIFLDEIGDLPLELQVKLLRVLQDGEFERLGSGKTTTVDVRAIAATNSDLKKAIQDGRFREDLYYRLNVFPITMPPLCERTEDIPELIWSFVGEFVQSMGKSVESIPRKTMETLARYPWPGNVRELRNVVERAMIGHQGPTLRIPIPDADDAIGDGDADSTLLDDVQRRHIVKMLERTRWQLRGKAGAAELLGMKPSTLEYRMKKLGIERPR
jgi:transcriptional regulator with GAF, ATPase, and Fis domain